MSGCSLTHSEASRNWPEGIVSAKITMNPYLLAMAEEKALQKGIKLWEFINVALWEKLGCPTNKELMEFAAEMELDDLDPKWKKRLKITSRHELEIQAYRETLTSEAENLLDPDPDGDKHCP